MLLPRPIWRSVLPVVLILLLVITTMGAVCHHHDGGSASNCTLCHMAIEPPAQGAGQCGILMPGAAALPQRPIFTSRAIEQKISPRAPPA